MEFNILPLLPQTTKIKIEKEIRKYLFSNKSVTEWGKLFKIHLKNMSRYINGTRSLSVNLLNNLILTTKTDINKLQGKIEIKIGKSGNYLKIGPFINIDEKWVYVGELIRGDGHITPNFWSMTFVNNNKALIDYVKEFFLSKGVRYHQITLIKRWDANFLIVRSSILTHIFNKIFNIPAGNKGKLELDVPQFIISDKDFGIAAVRGAFDAEGSITFTGSRRISITSNSKRWLTQLKQILENLRIESRITEDKSKRETPIYRLLIFHKSNLKKFLEIIDPLHTKRKEKLKEILNNYTKNPQREFHKKILLAIQNGKARKKEIAKDIHQNLIITGSNINWLRKKEFIEPYEKIYINSGSYYKYKITEKGENYLEKSLSFFD